MRPLLLTVGLASPLEAFSLITQHGPLPGQAGSRDFLFRVTFRAGTENQGLLLSLVRQHRGVDTSLGGPAPTRALPREALGEPL